MSMYVVIQEHADGHLQAYFSDVTPVCEPGHGGYLRVMRGTKSTSLPLWTVKATFTVPLVEAPVTEMVDVTAPEVVEVVIRDDSGVVWVNVDGACRFRACQVTRLEMDDRRQPNEVSDPH